MSVKSAERVFEILELFRRERRPLTLKYISAFFSYPPSSTVMLLKTMANKGYLSFDVASKAYIPTHNLTALGEWIPAISGEELASFVSKLQAATGESVVINILNDLLLEYVEYAIADYVDYPVDTRARQISALSPLGWALIAQETKPRSERIYRRAAADELIDRSAFRLQDFLAVIDIFRSYPWVVVEGWPTLEWNVITGLLPLAPQDRRLALGVGAAANKMRERQSELHRLIIEHCALLRPEASLAMPEAVVTLDWHAAVSGKPAFFLRYISEN